MTPAHVQRLQNFIDGWIGDDNVEETDKAVCAIHLQNNKRHEEGRMKSSMRNPPTEIQQASPKLDTFGSSWGNDWMECSLKDTRNCSCRSMGIIADYNFAALQDSLTQATATHFFRQVI